MKKWISGVFNTLDFQGRKILYGVMTRKAKKNEMALTYSAFGQRYIGEFMVMEERKGLFGKVKCKRLSEKDPAYKEVRRLKTPTKKYSDDAKKRCLGRDAAYLALLSQRCGN